MLPVCVLIVLAACGEGDSADPELDIDGSGDSTPSAPASSGEQSTSAPDAGAPDVSPAPEKGDKVEDDSGVWGLQLPESDPARTVGQAFVDYMEVRAGAFNTAAVDLTELSSVAMGDALTGVQSAIADLKQKKLRTVGGAWILIEDSDVEVKGRRATLSDFCFRNGSADVNAQNVAQESPPDAYSVDATAARVARDTWLISDVSFEEATSC